MVMLPVAVTVCGVLIALAGTRAALPDVPAWPRFWASTFFLLLFWPVGLALAERLAGRRAALALAAVLLTLSVVQQSGFGTMPLPQQIRLVATLAAPGDAIRQRILLPAAGDRRWQDALRRAHRAAVTVCSWVPVKPSAGVVVSVNDGAPVPLHSLPRFGEADGWGWYTLDVPRDTLERTSQLDVIVTKTSDGGEPAQICGGRDDPRRPGIGGASRFIGGRWQDVILADPAADTPGAVTSPPDRAPKRFYVELRLFDAEGHASVGIWH